MTDQLDQLPEWTDEERQLLASAALDRPPRTALPRTLQAATSAAIAAGTLATPAAALTLGGKTSALFGLAKQLGVVKWLALVALAGGAAVGVKTWRGGQDASRVPAHGPVTVRQAEPVSAPPAARVTEAPLAVSAEPSPAPSPAPRRATSARAEASVAAQPDLSRDIAALDEARRALRSGRTRDALAALERYDAEFGKNAALRVEAHVLRIEALARSGETARAQALAQKFIQQNPKSPYVERLRALLAR